MRVGKGVIKTVKDHSTLDHDSGDQSRSAFELSNDGANKLVLDEIQYQIDFLKSKTTIAAQRKAALLLINIFASPEKNAHQILRISGIEDTLLQLSELLESVSDVDVHQSILTMILLLLQGKDGSINGNIRVSKKVFSSWLYCRPTSNVSDKHRTDPLNSADSSPLKTARDDSKPVVTSVIHRKRKFAGSTATAAAILQPKGGLASSTNVSEVEGAQSDFSLSSADVTPVKKARPSSTVTVSPSAAVGATAPSTPLFTPSKSGSAHNSPEPVRRSQQDTPSSSSSATSAAVPLYEFAEKFRSSLFSPPASTSSSSLTQCGCIRDAMRILWPVMFSVFSSASAEEQQQQQDIEALRLILVNRWLTAKVNKLTTVSTSGYSSSSTATNNSSSAANNEEEDESSLLLQELNECQSLLRESQTLSSRTSQSMSRSNSAAHLSQQHSLNRTLHDTSEGGDGAGVESRSQLFLKQISQTLQGDLVGLAPFLRLKEEGSGSRPADLPLTLAGRLYLVLGIMEAACYRDPQNQQYLTKLKIHHSIFPSTAFGNSTFLAEPEPGQPSEGCGWTEDSLDSVRNTSSYRWSAARGKSLPLVLVEVLHSLTSEVVKCLKEMSQPGKEDENGQYWSVSEGAKWTHKDLTRFYRLFPEVAVQKGDPKLTLSSDHCLLHTVVDLGAHKLFASCLECLISITNNNESSCLALLSHKVPFLRVGPQKLNPQQSVVEFLVSLLSYFAAWRCTAVQQKKEQRPESQPGDLKHAFEGAEVSEGTATSADTSENDKMQGSGALSPSETLLERCSFDLTLFLLSLLTNVAEFYYRFHKQEVGKSGVPNASLMNVDLVQCVKNNSLLPWDSFSHGSAGVTSENSSLLDFLMSELSSGAPSFTDLHQFLIDLIQREIQDFLQDFVDTDEAINSSGGADGWPLLKDGGNSASTSISNKSEEVPIAELILSSHAVLLLHTLTVVTVEDTAATADSKSVVTGAGGKGKSLSRQNSTTSKAGDKGVQKEELEVVSYEMVLSEVRPRLPRSSWWLCIRILKAFMALQLQTGIMLLENVAPVLRTIQSMTAQDAQQSCSSGDKPTSLVLGSISAAVLKNEATAPDQDDFDALFTGGGGVSSNNKSKANVGNTASNSSQPPSKGEWKWNGSDFVWLTNELSAVHSAVGEATNKSQTEDKKVTLDATAAPSVLDWWTDPSDSQLSRLSSTRINPPASKPIMAAPAAPSSSRAEDSGNDDDNDSTVESGDVEIVEANEEEEAEEVEESSVVHDDFAPLQWFNRPTSWKTYGAVNKNSSQINSNSSSEGIGDGVSPQDTFHSKRKRAGEVNGGEGEKGGSILETERLFNAIVSGQSVISKNKSKNSSSSRLVGNGNETQESIHSSSASTLTEGSVVKGKTTKRYTDSLGDNDW